MAVSSLEKTKQKTFTPIFVIEWENTAIFNGP